MIRVKIPLSLRRHTGGVGQLELAGGTVADCLAELERRFPGVSRGMRDESGRLLASVSFYVNGEDVRYRSALETPLQSGDELTILFPIAGGLEF